MFERYNYNSKLIDRYISLFGKKETQQLLKYNELPLPKSIRVNTLKIGVKECIKRLSKKGFKFTKIPWCNTGFVVNKSRYSIGATTEYLLGYYYIQDPSSMAPATELNPTKEDLVLDMNAAPGGKTTHLAQLMKNSGAIIAVDKNQEKLRELKRNIERCGVENVITINMDATKIEKLNLKFDKILLDVTCTGEGTIRKNPQRKKTLQIKDFQHYSNIQNTLLKTASKVIKKGGILLYATCAMSPEENEMQIEYAVEELGFKVLPIRTKQASKGMTRFFGEEHKAYLSKTGRFYPHIHDTQGFFMAKLKKI